MGDTMSRMTTRSPTPTIRDAVRQDLPEILAIYNEGIRNSTAVYSEVEFTPARGETWFDTKAEQGFPFLVACDAGGVAGFRDLRGFCPWPWCATRVAPRGHRPSGRRELRRRGG